MTGSSLKILYALEKEYLREKDDLLSKINLCINCQDTFPTGINEYKELIDRLAQVEISLEQVLFFQQQINGNTVQDNNGDSSDS